MLRLGTLRQALCAASSIGGPVSVACMCVTAMYLLHVPCDYLLISALVAELGKSTQDLKC